MMQDGSNFIAVRPIMDSLNILIRTITSRNGQYSLRAGAGIVADSDPTREIAETRSKAEGMCRVFADA